MEVVNFKAFCANKNLSTKDVAEKLDISTSTVRAYFQGTRVPVPKIMNLMEQRLGMTPEMIYTFFIKDKE